MPAGCYEGWASGRRVRGLFSLDSRRPFQHTRSMDRATTNDDNSPTISRRATRSGLPQLGHYLSEALRYRSFAYYSSKADIKARNFETLLGRLWHFLNPLLFGLIYFIFVGIIAGGGLSDTGRLALIVGNLYAWMFFSTTVTMGVSSIQSAGGIMTQSAIPRVILPAASTLTSANLFMRSLLAYIPIHLIGGRGLHLELLWLPVLVVLTAAFGFGFALLFAVLNVYIRDVSRLLPHALRLWLYLSPAIWAYTVVLGHELETWARLNPMFSAMTAWTIALGGPLTSEPDIVSQVGVFAIWSLVILLIGFLVFASKEDDFAVRV